MKKVQIVYAVIASEKNLFFQELWASVYSFRLHEPDREIKVICDKPTNEYIAKFPKFTSLVTDIIVVKVPDEYSPRLRSRQLKTTVRKHIEGPYLFVDTDTICAGNIGEIDDFIYDVAAVPEYHLHLSESVFKQNVSQFVKRGFNKSLEDNDCWYNSGVMFVNNTPKAYDFCKRWHLNWKYSAFKGNCKQDQPALLMTNRQTNNLTSELPGEFNCQVGLSVKYLANAKIFHFLHFDYPKNQSFNPFHSKEIYRMIKEKEDITSDIAEMIKNVKSIYTSPSCVVGWSTMNFLMSPAAVVFEKIYNEGGPASWLMLKVAGWLQFFHSSLTKFK